jgi:hypothetical protein
LSGAATARPFTATRANISAIRLQIDTFMFLSPLGW